MATLGKQLEAKRNQQQQGRITRTDRIKQQQAQTKFNTYKSQADALQDTLWKPVEYMEQESYVSEYRPSNISAKDWNRRNNRTKQVYIKQMNSGYGLAYNLKRGRVVPHAYATRDVKKERPFTNEDYGNFYEKLDPNVKQFFVSKEGLETQQQGFRDTQKTTTQAEITKAQADLVAYKTRIAKKISDKNARWDRKSRKYRDDPKNRERYNKSVDGYEDDLEEKEAYYRGYIEKLNWGVGQLDAKQMYAFTDIASNAKDFGNYYEDREEARNDARDLNREQLKQGKLPIYAGEKNKTISGWIDPNSDSWKNAPDYLKNQKVLSKGDFAYYNNLINWSKKSGFENISDNAQKILNPQAVEWMNNPELKNEKLLFDPVGNIAGIESGAFGMSMNVENYNTKVTSAKVEYDKAVARDLEYKETARAKIAESSLSTFNDPSKTDVNKNQKWYQSTGDFISNTFLSQLPLGLFGKSRSMREDNTQKAIDARNENTVGTMTQFALGSNKPLAMFGGFDWKTGMEIVQSEQQMNYEEKEYSKQLKELNIITYGNEAKVAEQTANIQANRAKIMNPMTIFNPLQSFKTVSAFFQKPDEIRTGLNDTELRPYVMEQGLNVLGEKGLDMEEVEKTATIIPKNYFQNIIKDVSINEYDNAWVTQGDKKTFIASPTNNMTTAEELKVYTSLDDYKPSSKPFDFNNYKPLETETYKETKITDPAFDRKLSENMLDLETARSRDADTTPLKILKYVDTTIVGAGIVSTKALETYITWKGGEFVIKGAIKGYQGMKFWNSGKIIGVTKTGTFSGTGTMEFAIKPAKTMDVVLREGVATVPYKPSAWWGRGAKTLFAGVYVAGKQMQYQKYASTSPYGKELFWLETVGEVGGIEMATGIGRKTYNWGKNEIDSRIINRDKTLKMADISQQGFYRENKLLTKSMADTLGGDKAMQKVYMNTARPFKFSDKTTWNVRGLKEAWMPHMTKNGLKFGWEQGQFVSRVNKYIPDEVMAYYKYGGDVTITPFNAKANANTNVFYNLNNNGAVSVAGLSVAEKTRLLTKFPKRFFSDTGVRTIKAEPFPYDNPATHYDWVTRRNILEYGTGKYSEIDNIKKFKGFVYTATGEKWNWDNPAMPEKLYDKSGKLLAELKGAVQHGSGKGISWGFTRTASGVEEASAIKEAVSPRVYSTWLTDVKVNKATGEFKGILESGRELKYPIFRGDTGAVGTGNIMMQKKEVELVTEIEMARELRRIGAIRWGAWSVPVIDQEVGTVAQLTQSMSATGDVALLTNVGVSSMPSTAPISSFIGSYVPLSSRPSRSQTYSSVMSAISKVSGASNLSKVSRVSNVSRVSYSPSAKSRSSSFSDNISEIISEITKSPVSRISETPRNLPRPRALPLDIDFFGKSKKKKKRNVTPEMMGLFPDFTTRAIGLAPTKVKGVEGALNEIKKLRTGFEIRTGAKIDTNFMGKGKAMSNPFKVKKGKSKKPLTEKQLMRGIMA